MDDGERAARTSKLGGLVVRSEHAGDSHIIKLIGELDLDGAPRLEEELRSAEASDAASIVVDLGQLEFIDSTGLRMLVMAAERSQDGRFSLLRGPKQVHRVFEITDLAARLPFADA
ncbi:MAG TPA: STAS domain-containing protein [Solirubrobacteraceae bacterium]|jgi:anti-anti-sigma factor|nr:STAS domain-containing protein [Solirubrobacteraceae bacterium]